MKRKTSTIALCSALQFADYQEVPEWIHLLPAGEIRTVDGRGPYKVASLQSIAATSLKAGDKLPLDENHATDKGAVLGLAAPARGWIVELQARDDGLWGRVEWTGEGQRLMADKAYRGISPAILLSQDNTVLGVLRASLTNTPNLQGLVSLHSEETGMDWKAKLIELLGLDSGADDAAISAALTAKMGAATELCSQDLLAHPTVIALQSQLTELTGQLNTINEQRSRDAAVAFVDGAIAEGRVGVKPARDQYISLHMQDAERAAALISALPVLKAGSVNIDPAPQVEPGELDAGDRQVIALMGISEDDYRARLKATGTRKETI